MRSQLFSLHVSSWMTLLSAPGPAHSVPGGVGLDWSAYSEAELVRRSASASRAAEGFGHRDTVTASPSFSVTWSDSAEYGGGFQACFGLAAT
jgi:hypothetical protein